MDEQRLKFKEGFLTKCAELGLTPEESLDLVNQGRERIKTANLDELVGILGGGLKSVGQTASSLGTPLAIGALAAPPLLGFGAGYGLSQLTDIDDEDVDATKTQELIDEYRRAAELHRRRSQHFRRPAQYPVSAPPSLLQSFGRRGM